MNKTQESYEITSTLSVTDLADTVTELLKAQGVEKCERVAACFNNALDHLMRAGDGGLSTRSAIAEARYWLDAKAKIFYGLNGSPSEIKKVFISAVEASAFSLAESRRLPWLYDLVTARLNLLNDGNVERKMKKINLLDQKLKRHEYLTRTHSLGFDLMTHTYICNCQSQFERDKVVSLLASFDVMDVTSVFQAESKTWMVMGSYKDE